MSQTDNTSEDNSEKIVKEKPLPIIEMISNNKNLPLEDFLNDPDVISAIKTEDKIIIRYLDSEKIKKLIEYITKEPKENNYLIGYKYPYISCEILKMDYDYISERFILSEEQYYNQFLHFYDVMDDYDRRISRLKKMNKILEERRKRHESKNSIDKNEDLNKEDINQKENELNDTEEKIKEEKIIGEKNDKQEDHESNKTKNVFKENNNNTDDEIDNNNSDEKNVIIKNEEKDNINKTEDKENKDNNEYLDLLLDFVMSEEPELNYILSGYFSEVMINLLDNYPLEILKYIYTKRKDILKKIILRSYQKSFATLSEKLLDIYSLDDHIFYDEKLVEEFIKENVKYRNDLLIELLTSIDLKGLKYGNIYITNIENIFMLIIKLIKNRIRNILIFDKKQIRYHLYNVINTNLYDESEKNNEINFNNKYNIYCLFIKFISEFLKQIIENIPKHRPSQEDLENEKNKVYKSFKGFFIVSLEYIIKNNFRPKKNNSTNECLGILNIYIMEFVINMLTFMQNIPNEFDNILLKYNFCEKSVEYFFRYQWNNIYHNKFLEFFCLYINNESNHSEITNCFFHKIKLQNLLCDFLENKDAENNDSNIIVPKLKYEYKSGNKIKSGIYSHIIFFVYKIQTYSGLETFSQDEIKSMNIRHLGEFKFLKVNGFNPSKNKDEINISINLKNILSEDKRWCTMFKTIAFPVIKRYEIQLFKKEFNLLVNSKKVSTNNKTNKSNLNNENKTNNKIIEANQNININRKEIINIDQNYNDVNYWKIKIDPKLIIISDNNEKDEENELLNIALNSGKEEKKEKNNVCQQEDEQKKYINKDKKILEKNVNKENKSDDINKNNRIKKRKTKKNKINKGIVNNNDDIKNRNNNKNKNNDNTINHNEINNNENTLNNKQKINDRVEKINNKKKEKIDSIETIQKNEDEEINMIYNDVNYWKIEPRKYFNKKELEELINNL